MPRVVEHDFPRLALVLLVLFDPGQDFAVALTLLELFKQRGSLQAEKVKDMVIQGAIEFKLAIFTGEGGATLIEHAGKHDIPTQPGAGTAGRTLGEVWSRYRHKGNRKRKLKP